MRWAAGLVLFAGLWVAAYAGGHAQSNVQFSAQTYQSAPDGRLRQASLFVGDNRIRLEYRKGGLDIVEIYDMENRRVMFLVPQQKVYMQRTLLPGQVRNPLLPAAESNPCSVMPEGECRKLGSETLDGRPVSRWEVTVMRKGKTLHSLHWIDEARLMSLRDVWPDGSISVTTLTSVEDLGGRKTERWERTTTHADGKKDIATQWYDPELGIAVREELPGGFVRAIRHIQVGTQPATLFEVPKDYRLAGNEAQE